MVSGENVQFVWEKQNFQLLLTSVAVLHCARLVTGHLVVDGLGEGARALEPVDLGLVLGVVCERGHGLAAPQPAQHGHRGPGAATITVHLHAAEARARGHVSALERSFTVPGESPCQWQCLLLVENKN